MHCVMCNKYFRKTRFNPTDYCDSCIDEAEELQYNSDVEDMDVQALLHPDGKTKPVFYDD